MIPSVNFIEPFLEIHNEINAVFSRPIVDKQYCFRSGYSVITQDIKCKLSSKFLMIFQIALKYEDELNRGILDVKFFG